MTAQVGADLGLLTHLVDIADVDSTIVEISNQGKPSEKYPGKCANPDSGVVKFATSFYSDSNMATLMSGGCPDGFDSEDKNISRQLKSLKFAAPIGLKMASDLIDATAETNLGDGLQMELDGLDKIFATADALEGLSALIEGRRPTYNNA